MGNLARRSFVTNSGDPGVPGNLVTANQYSLETDASGWVAGANTSIARSTAQSLVGIASLALTASGAGTSRANTTAGLTGTPVVGGGTYRALFSTKAATVGRSVSGLLDVYNAAGAYITTYNVGTCTDSTSGWTEITIADKTIHALAAFADVAVNFLLCGAGEVHYMDKISLVRIS